MTEWPKVSLIVLNYNGLTHLQECFASLTGLDYPSKQLELMLVDNASTDGSVAYVQTHHPQVRIVRSPENVGFAAGNNLGAREATGQYVIFLNNDMWVEPNFVSEMIRVVKSDPNVVSVSAKILNWDGTKIDFAGGTMQISGHARQAGHNHAVDSKQFDEIQPTLFACGGAMMVDRQVFLDVGGFDEDYFIYFEDVDFGWRLWLTGYKVVVAPTSVVYHRHHGTMTSFSDHRKQLLYRRNALFSVIKNYSDENLGKVLPAILLAAVDGVVTRGIKSQQINPEDFYIKNSKNYRRLTISLDKTNVSTLMAIQEVVHHLPQLLQKRQIIQHRRRRSDEEVASLFKKPYSPWPDVNPHTVFTMIKAFDIDGLFASLPRRVLIISPDLLPYPGMPTVGSGLRAWGLGQGLKSRGHEVVFSMPKSALEKYRDVIPPEMIDLAWDPKNLTKIIPASEADIVLICGWSTLVHLQNKKPQVPVIVDQHGPHILERDYQKHGNFHENSQAKISSLRKADFFTCAGEKQMAYFQPWLAQAGWSEKEQKEFAAPIPFSLSPNLPDRQPGEPITFVFGGVFLPWQNPTIGLTTLVDIMEQRNCGRLYLFGGKHPTIPIDTGVFEPLMAQLQRSSRVTAPGIVPHAELIAAYTQAHVAIDLMERNPERELAFTSRTVEYLWCGLPVIYNNYSELSNYIQDYQAGWIVDPSDREAIASVINDIFDQPAQIIERSRNAQRLVREQLNWERTVATIDHFIRHPSMRYGAGSNNSQLPQRNIHYLIDEIRRHYERGGPKTVLTESLAFLRKEVGLF